MDFHVFGATTTTGQSFINQLEINHPKYNINKYSRNKKNFNKCDLRNPDSFISNVENKPSIWISLAPIWEFSNFIEYISINKSEIVDKIKCIIICSSSSVVTKKYAYNEFDQKLVRSLKKSEEVITSICKNFSIDLTILRPSLIYGSVNEIQDKSLSKIIKIMRIMPFIILPKYTGNRQPIHATQLSRVILKIANNFISFPSISSSRRFLLGGDTLLSYTSMISKIINSLEKNDPAKNCRIIKIPNRLFFFLVSPLILISPKYYSVFLRISVNMSGFIKSSKLSESIKEDFPILPVL